MAGQNAAFQVAYVYAQFQGIGGYDHFYPALEEPPLQLTALIGKQSSPVGFYDLP